MPIYEYQCKKCNTQFEVMQSISAKPVKTCHTDGCSGKVERLVSASGFILKGSGWYSSDYPSESRKQGWEKEQKAANPSADAHTCGSGCSHGTPSSGEATPQTAPAKESKPKNKEKNPYSGAKTKPKKASAAS